MDMHRSNHQSFSKIKFQKSRVLTKCMKVHIFVFMHSPFDAKMILLFTNQCLKQFNKFVLLPETQPCPQSSLTSLLKVNHKGVSWHKIRLQIFVKWSLDYRANLLYLSEELILLPTQLLMSKVFNQDQSAIFSKFTI